MAAEVWSENGAVDKEQKLKDQRQQLHQHFRSLPAEQHSHAWDSFWRQEVGNGGLDLKFCRCPKASMDYC